jgi:hypothetical protein
MKEVAGSNLKFACIEGESITVRVSANNTQPLLTFQPASAGTVAGDTLTIKVAKKSKSVHFFFGFSSTSGGSYDLSFTGSASDDSFFRNISQTQAVGPEDRIYSFLVG